MLAMNIAIFTDAFLPLTNGVVSVIVNSSKELAKRGHKVKIFAPRIKKSYFDNNKPELEGVELILYPSTDTFFHQEIKLSLVHPIKTLRELRNFKPDIIHFHTPFMVGIEGITAAKRLNIPLVGTFHTFLMDPEFLSNVKFTRFAIKPIEKLLWKYSNFIHEQADVLISPCEYTKNALLEHEIKTKVVQINNGIPINPHVCAKTPNHNCIYTGRLSPEKNIDLLLKSFALVVKKIPNAHLKIVGSGTIQGELEQLAKSLNISQNITFTGAIPNTEILKGDIFENQSVFINTSTSENQPMAVIEAMSFGMPIIAIRSKGMPELVEGNGLLCDSPTPEEISRKIIHLLNSPELIKKFSLAALEKSKSYDIKTTTNTLEKLYKSAI